MLCVTRKPGQQIVIDGKTRITITIVSVGSGRVRVTIDAPPEVRVDRAEVHDRREQENSGAA
jgi:carbon storage regulator CsrA